MSQGCPLLYLIAANILSWNLSKAASDGLIKGVYIQEMGEDIHTHNQFFDDTSCVIEAKTEYVEATLHIFKEIGNAFDLFIKEHGIKAIIIPQDLQ